MHTSLLASIPHLNTHSPKKSCYKDKCVFATTIISKPSLKP